MASVRSTALAATADAVDEAVADGTDCTCKTAAGGVALSDDAWLPPPPQDARAHEQTMT